MSKQQTRQKLFEEFDYKEKAGTAWSHNYLNQKPWHPLSYPNQRRKWIAEQMHGMTDKRKTEVEKEFQKEQDFFKSSALLSKRQREKVEAMQSVSFMYTKPPGYNAESARAAELADEQRKQQEQQHQLEPGPAGASQAQGDADARDINEALVLAKSGPMGGQSSAGDAIAPKRKPVVRDVFGNKVATEEDFEILKNAPRVETGIIGRAKPFGVEIRNVKCGRCGAVGHQSGDRECPMRDSVTEADVKRQQREDPLSLIPVQNRHQELTWEPKQAMGGMSPPRGGFQPDDPNQQILLPVEAEEEGGLVDQYGGFLVGADSVDPGLEGVSQSVLDALSRRQRKELRKALKARDREERRKKRKRSKEEKPHRKKRRKEESSTSTQSSGEDEVVREEREGRKRKEQRGHGISEDLENTEGTRKGGAKARKRRKGDSSTSTQSSGEEEVVRRNKREGRKWKGQRGHGMAEDLENTEETKARTRKGEAKARKPRKEDSSTSTQSSGEEEVVRGVGRKGKKQRGQREHSNSEDGESTEVFRNLEERGASKRRALPAGGKGVAESGQCRSEAAREDKAARETKGRPDKGGYEGFSEASPREGARKGESTGVTGDKEARIGRCLAVERKASHKLKGREDAAVSDSSEDGGRTGRRRGRKEGKESGRRWKDRHGDHRTSRRLHAGGNRRRKSNRPSQESESSEG